MTYTNADVIDTLDYATTRVDNQLDSQGTRKTFLAFTGFASMQEFYTQFDTWIRSLPDPETNWQSFE